MNPPNSSKEASGDPQQPEREGVHHAVASHLPEDLPALIDVPRAAALLGISRSAAYRFAAAGDLPSRRLGSRLYVVTHRLRELLDTA